MLPPTLAYVLPFAFWMVGVALRNHLGERGLWIYPAQTILVGIILITFRKYYRDLKPKFDLPAIAIGTLVFVMWIGLDPYLPHFERKTQMVHATPLWFVFRLLGASVIVPIIEELFWRSFLTRWIINPNWQQVPLGTFSWNSFIIVSVIFGFEHVEYASGIIAGLIYTGLLYWRKNLFSCILAHATTNLFLGIYVIKTENWQFW